MGNHLFNNMMRHTIEYMCIHTRVCSLHFILFVWLLCVYVYAYIYIIYTQMVIAYCGCSCREGNWPRPHVGDIPSRLAMLCLECALFKH